MTTSALVRLLAAPLAALALLSSAGGALARPCNVRAIVYEAVKTGKVSDGYSRACLQAARAAEPADISTYTGADSAILAAIARLDLGRQQTVSPADHAGDGPPASSTGPSRRPRHPTRSIQDVVPVPAPSGTAADGGGSHPTGPIPDLINAGANGPDAVPVPVIVLATLAALLTVGGAASFVVRRRLEAKRGSGRE